MLSCLHMFSNMSSFTTGSTPNETTRTLIEKCTNLFHYFTGTPSKPIFTTPCRTQKHLLRNGSINGRSPPGHPWKVRLEYSNRDGGKITLNICCLDIRGLSKIKALLSTVAMLRLLSRLVQGNNEVVSRCPYMFFKFICYYKVL